MYTFVLQCDYKNRINISRNREYVNIRSTLDKVNFELLILIKLHGEKSESIRFLRMTNHMFHYISNNNNFSLSGKLVISHYLLINFSKWLILIKITRYSNSTYDIRFIYDLSKKRHTFHSNNAIWFSVRISC